MREGYILLTLLLSINSYSRDVDPTLYQFKIRGKELKLTYDTEEGVYTWRHGKSVKQYDRRNWVRMLNDNVLSMPSDDYHILKERVKRHARFEKMRDPVPEEILEDAFKLQASIPSYVEPPTIDCNKRTQVKPANDALTIELGDSKSQEEIDDFNEKLMDLEMKRQGFFPLGELTKLNVEIMTSNDNILHGLLGDGGLEVTNRDYGKGIDGDDRGQTFGIEGRVEAEFEKGSIAISKYSKGFGRLTSKNRTVKIGDKLYTIGKDYKDSDGKYYQEFLNIDGLSLEVKANVGDKLYVKVIGKREVLDDQTGIAKEMQDRWHSLKKDFIRYNYQDHMEKRTRYAAELNLGKDFKITETENSRFLANIEAGRQFSTDGNQDEYFVSRAKLTATYDKNSQTRDKFPAWEASIFVEGKYYDDKEIDKKYGVELTKRFQVSENGHIYIRGRTSQDNNRYLREYGEEERKRRGGSYDLQHDLGLGYEYKW